MRKSNITNLDILGITPETENNIPSQLTKVMFLTLKQTHMQQQHNHCGLAKVIALKIMKKSVYKFDKLA